MLVKDGGGDGDGMVERERWVEGLYMLMELATHGDLFDKIGEPSHPHSRNICRGGELNYIGIVFESAMGS